MKVLVFTTLFPNKEMPNHAAFIRERVRHMAKLCDITVVAPVPYFPRLKLNSKWYRFSQIPLEEEIDGVKVYHPRYLVIPGFFRCLYGYFIYLGTHQLVKRLYKKNKYDILEGHFIYPDCFAAVKIAKQLGVKVAINARGTDINWYPKFYLIRKQIKDILNSADIVISVSSDLKKQMIELGCDENKIAHIHNGVAKEVFFYMPKAGARKILKLSEDGKIILSVGLLIERKGFHLLIEALKLIEDNSISLYIIGDGEWKDKLTELIDKLGLNDRIHIVPTSSHERLRLWYTSADLFCLVSLREGVPNVIKEALACGTPVLSMNKWGLKEFVGESNGCLIESYKPADIARNIQGALTKQWDHEAIVKSVERFDWNTCVTAVKALYERL